MPVIKRIHFAGPDAADGDGGLTAAWRDRVARVLDAPADARPVRFAICTALPDVIPEPRHPGLALEWFRDPDHLARSDAWRSSTGVGEADVVVVAEEHVLRGDAWLAQRWRDGGAVLKHVALATRAAGLTASEFRTRWLGHAGSVGTTPIPDEARGRAYAQNHPVPRTDGEWGYDAVNEVWFDDVDALRARVAWLAGAAADRADRDLFGASWFLAVREELRTGR